LIRDPRERLHRSVTALRPKLGSARVNRFSLIAAWASTAKLASILQTFVMRDGSRGMVLRPRILPIALFKEP